MSDITASRGRLIAGQKVAGTDVFNTDLEKLGTIEDVMIDKPSGRIAYAVLSFGGFLGIGGKHHPLPWQTRRYDPALGGYVVDLDRRVLEGAPAYEVESELEDEQFGRRLHDYYNLEPTWSIMP